MNLSFSKKLIAMACLISGTMFSQNCDHNYLMEKNISLLSDYKLVKSFPVETNKQSEKAEYSYVLNANTKYRIVNAQADGKKMIVIVKDRGRKIIASNKDKQKKNYSPVLDFTCAETGVYFFEVKFENDERTCGLNILGFQK